MSLWERLIKRLKRLFKRKKKWYTVDMTQFVKNENARYISRTEAQ